MQEFLGSIKRTQVDRPISVNGTYGHDYVPCVFVQRKLFWFWCDCGKFNLTMNFPVPPISELKFSFRAFLVFWVLGQKRIVVYCSPKKVGGMDQKIHSIRKIIDLNMTITPNGWLKRKIWAKLK